MNNMSWIITSISYIISLNYLQMCKSPSMTSCLWSKFAEFKLWGWRCTLWWWKRRLQSWYAFLHKGLHAWQVQCLTNTFFNVCWWHRLDRVVYNARKRDGTILGGGDGCCSRQESNSNVEVETNRQTLFGVSGSCKACLQLWRNHCLLRTIHLTPCSRQN